MSDIGDGEANGPKSTGYGDADSKIKLKSFSQEPTNQTKPSRCPEFCQLIGRRETRNIELSKRERDLRRRLEMLECWMPAVTMMRMMTSDVKADDIARVIDKQAARMTVSCLCPNSTLSQHRDVRIREVEGKRKKAQKRLEEAKQSLENKQTAVEEQLKRIEEERKKRECLETRIKKLEARISMSNNLNKAQSAESVASIGPDELMYLTKLEELVKSEEISKKHLEELEKRQEMYMKALESAGQVWNEEEHHQKVDGLKSQLEVKSSANHQLAERICELEDQVETLKSKLIACNDQLKSHTEKKSVGMMIGTDQTYRDASLLARPEFKEVSVIYDDSEFTVDEEIDATVAMGTRETSTNVEVTERAVQELVITLPEQDDAETTTEHELLFISLQGSVSKGDTPSSALVYDSSMSEVGSRFTTTKFDVQTQTEGNYAFIEIPELEMWETNIDKVRMVVVKCDTCKTAKPEVTMIQEAINRQLGKGFAENDDENSPQVSDKITLAEPNDYHIPEIGSQSAEDQIPKIDKKESDKIPSEASSGSHQEASKIDEEEQEIDKFPEKIQSSEIFLAKEIDDIAGIFPSTPPQSLGVPVAMSTPQLMKRISNDNIHQNNVDKLPGIDTILEKDEYSSLLATIAPDHSASMGVNDASDKLEMKRSDKVIEHVEIPRSSMRTKIQSGGSIDGKNVPKSSNNRTKSSENSDNVSTQRIDDIGVNGSRENGDTIIPEHKENEIIQEDIQDDPGRKNRDEVQAIRDEEIRERKMVASRMTDEAKVDGDGASYRVGTNVGIRDGEIGGVEEEMEKMDDSQVQGIEGEGIGGNEIKRNDDEGGNKDDEGSMFIGDIAVSKSTLRGEIAQHGSSKIRSVGGMRSVTGNGQSVEKFDDGRIKCPVTEKLSGCICHALRRWPRMTRKEYRESREAITKIPPPTQQPGKIIGSKTVSSATVTSIEIQTNVERPSGILEIISDAIPTDKVSEDDEDMCDPCECDPCASVSSTSSEQDSIQTKKPIVETRDQGTMAKIYKPRR